MKTLPGKRTLSIFGVLLFTFIVLIIVWFAAQQTMKLMDEPSKEVLKALIQEKTDTGHDDYQALQLVMNENPELIIQMGKDKNSRNLVIAVGGFGIAIIFLYLASLFISVKINAKT